VPDFVYNIAVKASIGFVPRPVKHLMRQRLFKASLKLVLAVSAFYLSAPRVREFMGVVRA
jgi:hypothetical protein